MFYFSKKVRLFLQNDVLFLFYFLINLTMTTGNIKRIKCAAHKRCDVDGTCKQALSVNTNNMTSYH